MNIRRLPPLLIAAASLIAFRSVPQVSTITVDPATTYQTFDGWEATANAAQIDGPLYAVHPGWATDSPVLMDLLVNDLGLTRLRLEVRSGAENPTDYYQQFQNRLIDRPNDFRSHMYEVVNDNADPNVMNPSGFHWTELDETVQLLVMPFRAKVFSGGQTPYISLSYVDFDNQSAFKHSDDPAEYAEFILAAFQHLQATYGWVPDALDVILEGDIAQRWQDPIKIGRSLAAASARLAAAGFHPAFIAPSATSLSWAVNNFDAMVGVPGVATALNAATYHLYWNNADADLIGLSAKATARGMKTGMTELIGADHTTLSNDLRKSNVSFWQQYSMASYYLPDGGGKYYINTGSGYFPGDRTRYLRQYMRYIRPGAVRIGATSLAPELTPVAFINPGGKYTVVANATSGVPFTVSNLPAGTYGIRYTTASATDVNPGNQTITAGGTISTSIPAAGVLTIFNVSGQGSAPPGSFSKSSPAGGATSQPASLALAWTASGSATGYEYCLDTVNNAACDTSWLSAGSATSASVSGLTSGATYYWQVRAINTTGTTYADAGATAFSSFTVQSQIVGLPAAFGKVSPVNGSTGIATTVPVGWSYSAGATALEYCVDTTNNGVCDTGWVNLGLSNGAWFTGLATGTTYYWQARATNAAGTTYADGSASAFWAFTTQGGAAPGAFAKTAPAGGATGLAMSVSLAWSASTGAISYEYCLDTSNNGVCDSAWTNVGATLGAGISGLLPNTSYFWQVRANNASGTATYADGVSTAFFAFTTQGTGPAAFNKVEPANGVTGIATTFPLGWSFSLGATAIEYCVDTTNNGVCDTAWVNIGLSNGVWLSGLATGTTYYWQVRAINAGGIATYANGSPSAFWSLTTQAGQPGAFAKTAPANAATGIATSVTLSWSASSGATGYEYCIDSSSNNACDAAWVSAGGATSAVVSGLGVGSSYSWQVRATNSTGTPTYADGAPATFWNFQTVQGQSAQLTTPASGSTLTASNVTFQWTGGLGATRYWLSIGSTQGATDVFDADMGTNLTVNVDVPVDGRSLYVHLQSLVGGLWQANDYVLTAARIFSIQKAELSSPAPRSTLTASTVTFDWSGGAGATGYRLSIGNAQSVFDLLDENEGTALKAVVSGLPTDGRLVFVRLWSQFEGAWEFNDYVVTAATTVTPRKAELKTPAPASTLTASTVTFEWTGGTGVTATHLAVGTSPGTGEFFENDVSDKSTVAVTGLPTDGRTVYIRLSSQIAGEWQANDYTVASATIARPAARAELTTPAPGSTLAASSVTFEWTGGTGASGYWLYVGNTPAGNDVVSRDAASNLSALVTGVPTDGRTLYVRLFSHIGEEWQFNDYVFTAATIAVAERAQLVSPAPESTLTATGITFQWSGGAGVSAYRLAVGTNAGAADLADIGPVSDVSANVGGLPTDGRTIYVRLGSLIAGAWQYNDYTFRAMTLVQSRAAELVSPAPGSTLTSTTAKFRWTAGVGAAHYRLIIGSRPGSDDIAYVNEDTALGAVVSGLPSDGRAIYVSLYSYVDGAWQRRDYVFTAAGK